MNNCNHTVLCQFIYRPQKEKNKTQTTNFLYNKEPASKPLFMKIYNALQCTLSIYL